MTSEFDKEIQKRRPHFLNLINSIELVLSNLEITDITEVEIYDRLSYFEVHVKLTSFDRKPLVLKFLNQIGGELVIKRFEKEMTAVAMFDSEKESADPAIDKIEYLKKMDKDSLRLLLEI